MRVIDIKCTSRHETDWPLQVGGLQSMLPLQTAVERDADFRYHGPDGDEYASVTRLLRQLGFPKSWTGKAPVEVVRHAIDRGKVIEETLYRAFESGDTDRLEVPADWQEELNAWWPGFWNWLDDHAPAYRESRVLAGDPQIRCAGEIDLVLSDDGPPAALHLNPKFARGYILRAYPGAVSQWTHVREARLQELAAYRMAHETLGSVIAAETARGERGEQAPPPPPLREAVA